MRPTYELEVGAGTVVLNEHLGAGVTLVLEAGRHCIHCDAAVRKLFGGGFCYDCFSSLARCDLCMVSPDRCHYHAGTCREPEWGESYCMQPHVVYLANTSGPKIGITRADRVWRRWLDQGAAQALVVADVPTRRAAGAVEAHFKRTLNDRTDWRRLVSGDVHAGDLPRMAGQMRQAVPDLCEIAADNLGESEAEAMSWHPGAHVTRIEYPVKAYCPPRRVSLSAQVPVYRDNLIGVLGQYLLFSRAALHLGAYRGMALSIEFGAALDTKEIPPANQGNSDQFTLFD